MIFLNIHNTEELIFYDNNLKKLLPEFVDLFNQWSFAKQYVGFRQLVKRTVSDFLETIGDDHIVILEKYFGTKVAIDKMDYKIVKNTKFSIGDDIELLLNNVDDFSPSIYRDNNHIYVTFWR